MSTVYYAGVKRSAASSIIGTISKESPLELSDVDKSYFEGIKELFKETRFPLRFDSSSYCKSFYLKPLLKPVVFSLKNLKKGDVIGEVYAKAIVFDETPFDTICEKRVPLLRIREKTLSTAKIEGDLFSSILHSEAANVAFKIFTMEDKGKVWFRLLVVAIKAIKAGELLLRDYGIAYTDTLDLKWSYLKPKTYLIDFTKKILITPPIGIPKEQSYFIEDDERDDLCEEGLSELLKFSLEEISVGDDLLDLYEEEAATIQTLEGHSIKKPFFYDRRHLRFLIDFLQTSSAKIPYFLTLTKIKDLGWGVFANRPIATDVLIGVYTGKLLDLTVVDDDLDNSYFFNLTESLVVDAKNEGNYTRFFNHSKAGNLKSVYMSYKSDGKTKACIAFFTNQPVSAGEQLLFDYGSKYDWSFLDEKKPAEINPRTIMIDPRTGLLLRKSHKRPIKVKIYDDE
jgi:hypothetical protein